MIQVMEVLENQYDKEKKESYEKDYIETMAYYISDNMLRMLYLITLASK
jgi:hypothetical protein